MIQTPLHEHRVEMSKKFENRVDYVDITAYGARQDNTDKFDETFHQKLEESQAKSQKSDKSITNNENIEETKIDKNELKSMANASNPNNRILYKI